MPTYDYKCTACGEKREIPTRSSGVVTPRLVLCPRCDGEMQRIYTAPAVIFKGDGFYSTENRRNPDEKP